MSNPVRPTDISGRAFPPVNRTAGEQVFVTWRPPQFEPPPGAREFIVSYSVVVPAASTTALFTFVGEVLQVPSCAVQLPPDTQARISGVTIGGDTDVGVPVLTFSLRDRTTQRTLFGWEGIGLPGRGGIVAVGFEPFTTPDAGSFFGGVVVNSAAAPKYAEMMMQGWMW